MTLTVIEVGGTYQLWDPTPESPPTADPSSGWFNFYIGPNSPHADLFNYQVIAYPGTIVQMQLSVDIAEAHIRTVLAETPGKFALIGTSQGGIVCSNIYDALRTGDLQDRRADFVGAFMYGNPRRQRDLVFPGCPNPMPGSGGLDLRRLLTDCEGFWWEFARPGDLICIATDDDMLLGDICFNFVLHDYTGCGSLFELFFHPQALNVIGGVLKIVNTIWLGMQGIGGHSYSDSWLPLAPDDTRGAVTIAVDRLIELAATYG